MGPLLGVILHAVGGFAAGSFYMPYKAVRGWAWEVYWIAGGFFSWIIVPWALGFLMVPDLLSLLRETPSSTLFWTYFFGVLWGVGGLTFGLSMRYLGMSLGYALALGFCAAFGTLVPPIFTGKAAGLVAETGGQVTLAGIGICLLGIAICGRAGMRKENELSDEEKRAVITEFNFVKGVWVAIFAGIMSACMAFAITAGESIGVRAVESGTPALFQVTPVFIVIMAGGFTTNFLWCLALMLRNKTLGDFMKEDGARSSANFALSALAGTIWYGQFLFYGMGTTQMGAYDFSSWTLHMAFIIVFSNVWGLILKEWKGASKGTVNTVLLGIGVLIASTIVIGIGNYLGSAQ
jgi:L-rhamnose-H+ transport protein